MSMRGIGPILHTLARSGSSSAVAAVLLAFLSVGVSLWHHWDWPATVDEGLHLNYGLQILQKGSFHHFDESQMPVSVLNALAVRNDGSHFAPPLELPYWRKARAPSALWLGLLVAAVALWAGRLYGPRGAWVAGAAAAVEPNLSAHGTLITTDVPCAAASILCAMATSATATRPTLLRGALLGILLGAAQATKYSSAYLIPLLLLGVLLQVGATPSSQRPRFTALLLAGLLAAGTAIPTLLACYGFQGFPVIPSEQAWRSNLLQGVMPRLGALPLPIPWDWVEGLDWVKQADELGPGGLWVAGRWMLYGTPEYFLVAAGLKVPLGILGMLLLAWFTGPFRPLRQVLAKEALLWVPFWGLALQMSFALNFQIGLRFLLPAFPFALVLLGRLGTPSPLGRVKWMAAWLGIAAAAVSVGLFPERWVGYTNGWVPRLSAWRWIADSNLDWGQDRDLLKSWQEEPSHGNLPFNAGVVQTGPQMVSVNHLVGLATSPRRYRALRECGKVGGGLGTSYLLFETDPVELSPCLPSLVRGPGLSPPLKNPQPGWVTGPAGEQRGFIGTLAGAHHLLSLPRPQRFLIHMDGGEVSFGDGDQDVEGQVVMRLGPGWHEVIVTPKNPEDAVLDWWMDAPGRPVPVMKEGMEAPSPTSPVSPTSPSPR